MSEYICKRKDERYTFKADNDTCEFSLPSWEPIQEIVRCRDCKFMTRDMRINYCIRPQEFHEFAVEPDGFCAWAVKRDD